MKIYNDICAFLEANINIKKDKKNCYDSFGYFTKRLTYTLNYYLFIFLFVQKTLNQNVNF